MLNFHFERKYHFVKLKNAVWVCFFAVYLNVLDRLFYCYHITSSNLSCFRFFYFGSLSIFI